MAMHRKNGCRSGKRGRSQNDQPWFTANVKRQRRRNELAKLARRRNRGR